MTDDTLQLIRRAQAGDRQAFAALFAQYKNLVYRTAFLMLGNAHDAEDTLQEVFVLVHRALSGFDPRRAAFSTWLHRITINQCREAIALIPSSFSTPTFAGKRIVSTEDLICDCTTPKLGRKTSHCSSQAR